MKTLNHAARIIRSEMIANGTMKRISERQAKHEQTARELGFANAQAAFNSMGKSFLIIANA